jgi:hypothetical protein
MKKSFRRIPTGAKAHPNRARPEESVRRRFFLRMLACHVERHMRRA